MIIQVSAHPFGECGSKPKMILEDSSFAIKYNPFKRRLTEQDIPILCKDASGIVAGTEPYTKDVLKQCTNLKVISRVGVGYDSVDLDYCNSNNIIVTYTPDAPSPGVAELTVANILNLARSIVVANNNTKGKNWKRIIGTLLEENIIGILGVGRIGKRVIKLLQPFNPVIYACDLQPDLEFGKQYNVNWVSHEDLFESCDIISVHVPLNEMNRDLVSFDELNQMKKGSYLINTSRGPIVNEQAVLQAIQSDKLAGFAADVFTSEPYSGKLIEYPNVILTPHIGASTYKTRFLMELGAAMDCVRVLSGQSPLNPIN